MKLVINRCWGGFGLSPTARRLMGRPESSYDGDIARDDPKLVAIVEKLAEKASDSLAALVVVEIPDGTEWEIEDYDGMESVHAKHESWP
jgi:hypothetical protein